MLMWAQLPAKVSWLWRTRNNLQRNPQAYYPKRGQYEQTLVGFHVHWQVTLQSSYSRTAWNRAVLSFLGQRPAQISSCCQRWQHHLSQRKHKNRGRSVSKIKASTLGPSSKQTNRQMCFQVHTSELGEADVPDLWTQVFTLCRSPGSWMGLAQVLLLLSKLLAFKPGWATELWNWARRDLRDQLNPTPLSQAETFSPRPDCTKPHHIRQILQTALWKACAGTSKIDLSIHIRCILTAFSCTSHSHKDSVFSSKIMALYLACLHFKMDYLHGNFPRPLFCSILATKKVW